MEKLRLTLDDLQVQSFLTTGQEVGQRATVRAHDATVYEPECASVELGLTCDDTCGDTCPDTCRETCGCYDGTWWWTQC